MRWLFWVLFIMGLAIGVSLLAGVNSGYVLVKTPTYRLETSLNFLIVTISLTFVLLHLAFAYSITPATSLPSFVLTKIAYVKRRGIKPSFKAYMP